MAKIIGESDCTDLIKYNLSRFDIRDISSFEDIKSFKENCEEILKNETNPMKKEILNYLMTKRYYGAVGEEKVIDTLKLLPDTYYILNEVQIRLTKSVLWKKYFEYAKITQIDHVVIGDTGIFLIETKNWKEMNLTSVNNSPHKQIDRAGFLFWLAQKKKLEKIYKTYNLVVTLKDLPKYNYKFVYQLTIKDLNNFILSRHNHLTIEQIEHVKTWLINLKYINPRSLSSRFY